jgi:hypothetical protein
MIATPKFKVGDQVQVVTGGYGLSGDCRDKIYTITCVSDVAYCDQVGYVIEPPEGNCKSGNYGGVVGEKSFKLFDGPVSPLSPETILNKARRDYPVGTSYIDTESQCQHIVAYTPMLFYCALGANCIIGASGGGLIYNQNANKWAKVVDRPQLQLQPIDGDFIPHITDLDGLKPRITLLSDSEAESIIIVSELQKSINF